MRDHQQHNVTKISLLVSRPTKLYPAQTKHGCVFNVPANVCFCTRQLESCKACVCKTLYIPTTASPHRGGSVLHSQTNPYLLMGQGRCASPPIPLAGFSMRSPDLRGASLGCGEKGVAAPCPAPSAPWVGQPYSADGHCSHMDKAGQRRRVICKHAGLDLSAAQR